MKRWQEEVGVGVLIKKHGMLSAMSDEEEIGITWTDRRKVGVRF